MKKIYLAIPYTCNPEKSFSVANRVAAQLLVQGYLVYSPISHSHPIAPYLPKDLVSLWAWWATKDLPMVDWADEVHVVAMGENGYDLIRGSVGVQAEIAHAEATRKPVKFIEHD